MSETQTKPCAECATPFVPRDKAARFCSAPCRVRWSARDWRRRNPERAKELDRKSHAPKREQRNAKVREWHARHRDEQNAKGRQRYAENRDIANAGRRVRYFSNHEQNKANQIVRNHATRAATPWLSLLFGAMARARKKKVPFELTQDWAASRWTGRCEMTGIAFRFKGTGPGPKVFSPSIDRIEPKLGYVPSNCRFILWAINAMKGEATDAEVFEIAEAIVEKVPVE